MTRDEIYERIDVERTLQNVRHPNFDESMALAVLIEEVGEVGKAIQNEDNENLRDELIQVAASAIRWLEARP